MAPTVSPMLSLILSSLLLLASISQATSSDSSPFGFVKNLQGSKKGVKVEGIHKVKKYLQHFGYLSSTRADSDDFDDELESAIKAFQAFYNLKPTGMLDAPTAEQLDRPRCGVSDNPSGTQISHAHAHLNIGSHYTFFSGKPKWPPEQRHLLYYLSDNPHPEAGDAVERAFKAWATFSNFTFERSQDSAKANLHISFQVRDHGDGSPFDGPRGILAHAFAPKDGRFHYDGDEKWVVGAVDDAFDLQTVATHEIGHLLGLQHSKSVEAIMYAYIDSGRTKALSLDDIAGIRDLYSG